MARYLSSTQWLRWTLSYPMLAWDTHLPNGCVGHSATQFTRRIVEQDYRAGRIPIHFGPTAVRPHYFGYPKHRDGAFRIATASSIGLNTIISRQQELKSFSARSDPKIGYLNLSSTRAVDGSVWTRRSSRWAPSVSQEIIQVGTQRSSFIYLFGFGLHRHWKGQNARFLRRQARCPFSLTARWAETVHVVYFSHSQDLLQVAYSAV